MPPNPRLGSTIARWQSKVKLVVPCVEEVKAKLEAQRRHDVEVIVDAALFPTFDKEPLDQHPHDCRVPQYQQLHTQPVPPLPLATAVSTSAFTTARPSMCLHHDDAGIPHLEVLPVQRKLCGAKAATTAWVGERERLGKDGNRIK